MAKRYDVFVRVVSKKGTCGQKHKAGDEWVIKRKTPEGICLGAFSSIYPSVRVLMYGGALPWERDPDVITRPPDLRTLLTFLLTNFSPPEMIRWYHLVPPEAKSQI